MKRSSEPLVIRDSVSGTYDQISGKMDSKQIYINHYKLHSEV